VTVGFINADRQNSLFGRPLHRSSPLRSLAVVVDCCADRRRGKYCFELTVINAGSVCSKNCCCSFFTAFEDRIQRLQPVLTKNRVLAALIGLEVKGATRPKSL